MKLPDAERANARVKTKLKREDRRDRIAEIIKRFFPDPDCLKTMHEKERKTA
jgi:hypothetical protein